MPGDATPTGNPAQARVPAQNRYTTSRDVGRMAQTWTERWAGGSPAAELEEFRRLALDIMRVQAKNRRAASAHDVPHAVDRAFHAKATLAVDDAELTFLDLPPDLRVGFAQPHASYRTTVRFSNAAGISGPDGAPDLRGVARRVHVEGGGVDGGRVDGERVDGERVDGEHVHDLLMTNFPVSHARDARQFVEFAKATAGGRL